MADDARIPSEVKIQGKPAKICRQCGSVILGKGTVFCSNQHKIEWHSFYSRKAKSEALAAKRGVRQCRFCNKEFRPLKPNAEHCSRICQSRTGNAQARQKTIDSRVEKQCGKCGRHFSHGRRDKKFCSDGCATEHHNEAQHRRISDKRAASRKGKVCPRCKEEFEAKRSDAEYCSKICWDAVRLAEYRQDTIQKRQSIGNVSCMNCGARFELSRLGQKFCTNSCAKNHSFKINYAKIVEAREKEREAVPNRECRQCGKTFTPTHRDVSRQKFCSSVCNMRHHSSELHARRMEIMTAPTADKIDWLVVGDRYGWKCGMCSCEVVKEHRGKRRLTTPEIDHVVPLSKGGTHTYNNIQLLCFPCNRSKLAKIIPGMTSLFAD